MGEIRCWGCFGNLNAIANAAILNLSMYSLEEELKSTVHSNYHHEFCDIDLEVKK